MKSASLFRRRIQRFRSLRRGYYSFLVLLGAYLVSFLLPLLVGDTALAVRYQGEIYFPIARYHPASRFGGQEFGPPNYRELQVRLAAEAGGGNWVLLPPYPYSPTETLVAPPMSSPSGKHIFGTDDRGRDVFAQLAYGFNVSLSFALIVLALSYAAGIVAGGVLGYFGGKLDMLGLRGIEIWSSVPFLYTVIILSSVVPPVYTSGRSPLLQQSFWLLVGIVSVFSWMGITYYVRGEFYREKAKDYTAAAVATGVSDAGILFRHILPNALTPVIAFAPFAVVTNISVLVALDFLGFGLPAPTPSWGELIRQGVMHLRDWWLVLFPLGALCLTLLLIVFVGEAVREAFDPKPFSRLR